MADALAVNVSYPRQPVVLLVALAVISLQLVRAEHIHPAGIEGRSHSIVHSHLAWPAGSGSPRAHASHGDHRFAIFPAAVYESVLRSFPQRAGDTPAILHTARSVEPHRPAAGIMGCADDCHPPGHEPGGAHLRAPPVG